jgi:hypothetical protein
MKTENTSHSLNTLPLLSEEMERTLRLRAWRDELFREALIANPKGVVQRLFPQCFPNGKIPEQLTINVIKEDPGTCHIVLPPLPDEFPTLEIPEEEQLEFVANMGAADRMPGRRDSLDNKGESRLPEKPRVYDATRAQFNRLQEAASEPLRISNLGKDMGMLAGKDPEFKKELITAVQDLKLRGRTEPLMNIIQERFSHYLQLLEKKKIEVVQNTSDNHNFVLQSPPDDFGDRGVPTDQKSRDQLNGACSTLSCPETAKL